MKIHCTNYNCGAEKSSQYPNPGLNESNKAIIPFALAGYVIGHIKIGAKRLVVYIQSHIQRVHGKLLKNLNEIDISQGLD